jgi:antitoxin MazE
MQKLTRWGNSTGLRIPAEVLSAAGLKAGAHVYVRLLDSGDIRVRPVGVKQSAHDGSAEEPGPMPSVTTKW